MIMQQQKLHFRFKNIPSWILVKKSARKGIFLEFLQYQRCFAEIGKPGCECRFADTDATFNRDMNFLNHRACAKVLTFCVKKHT